MSIEARFSELKLKLPLESQLLFNSTHRHLNKIDRSLCPECSAIFSPDLLDFLLRLAT